MAIKCNIRAENDGIMRGLGKKVHGYWTEKNMFEISEKNLINQIRTIMSKRWLIEVEIETVNRKVKSEKEVEERTEVTVK